MSKHINKYRNTVNKSANKSAVSIVTLSSYTSPKVVESSTNEWVGFGADNNYFQYIIDRYNGSATNNAAINGISQMIFGKGLDALNSSKNPESYARMISLLKKDDVRKNCYDLKLTGQTAIQVVFSNNGTKVEKVTHFPIETLRAEKCGEDDDKVNAYFYHPDWTNIKPSDVPLRIPAFNSKPNGHHDIEILYIKPYRAGMFYYATPDYQGCLQYAELEEEVSNYHINNVQNSMAPSMLINFNNGVPDEATQTLTENKIKAKFSGSSNSGKFILAFNDNKESAADITPVQLSDAPQQYQFLATEAEKKIMVGHRVISPMLMGVKDNTGLGNNAEELKTATILMDNTVIRPFQELLIDGYTQILAVNNISLKLYFKTLQPLEFTDLENVKDQETREEETGVKMSKQDSNFNDEEMLNSLDGEQVSDEWELVDSREYNEQNESIEDWAKYKIKEKLSIVQKLANVITSKPNGFSYLDKSFYKVRYEYKEKYSSGDSRNFCKTMMQRTAKGVVYRLEDIDKASRDGVNKTFGHKGQSYDLFKYKGGVQCGHVWSEQLYRLKKKTEKGANQISKYDETDSIPSTYKPKPNGNRESKIAPKDMPNGGAYPSK